MSAQNTVTISPTSSDPLYNGLGTHIWPEDPNSVTVACQWGFTYFRSAVGPNWDTVTKACTPTSTDASCPPIGQGQDAYDKFVASQFNADCPSGSATCHSDALKQIATVKSQGLKWIQVLFQLPRPLVTVSGSTYTLNAALLKDAALFYSALGNYVKTTAGVSADYFEILNEPDATWNAQAPPDVYVALLKQVYSVLITRYPTTLIGPGTSQFNPSISGAYIDALDADALKALGGFSVHGWDTDTAMATNFDSWLSAVKAKDANKPVLVTEYGLSDNADRASAQYASNLVKTTFQILQRKPQVLIQWEASDEAFEGSQVWGLTDTSGKPYIAGQLFQNFLPYFKFSGSCYFDVAQSGTTGLDVAAIRGSLNGVDSVVAAYWNEGGASQNFKHSVNIQGQTWTVSKSIKIDSSTPTTTTGGYQGTVQPDIAAGTGALYVFTSAPPASRRLKLW